MQHPGNGRAEEGAEFPQHLKVLRQLGRGAYGTVHLCEDVRSGSQVAVKHVKNAVRHGKSMVREIHLLAGLRHENLLHLIDFCAVARDFDDVFLVLPYMPADLHKVIQSKQALTEKHVQVIMAQILRAMAHLHACGVAHRDLKPANVLISGDCKLKVCDFGLARGDMLEAGDEGEQAGVLTEYVVTRWYRAPELLCEARDYGPPIDVWSVGCVFAEMLRRKPFFRGDTPQHQLETIVSVLGRPSPKALAAVEHRAARDAIEHGCTDERHEFKSYFPRDSSSTALDLLQQMLVFDPAERASVEQCLEHPYLSDLHGQMPEPLCEDAFDFEFERPDASSEAKGEQLPREELQSMMFEEMVQLQLIMEDGGAAKEEEDAPEAK